MLKRLSSRSLMHCMQCEQTSHNIACRNVGVCGKQESTAGLQDLLVHDLKGLAALATLSKASGRRAPDAAIELYREALFSTLTNVNFDDHRMMDYLRDVHTAKGVIRAQLPSTATQHAKAIDEEYSVFKPTMNADSAHEAAEAVGNLARMEKAGGDVFSLQELVQYGLKGAVAYLQHAERVRGVAPASYSKEHSDQMNDQLLALGGSYCLPTPANPIEEWLGRALEVGKVNLDVMLALDQAHNTAFGTPTAVSVNCTPKVSGRPAIVVSGHDIVDLEPILRLTQDAGVDVYTHGEILPAHGYPEVRKYPHLVGHYGTAWQNQWDEFKDVPGVVVMTTNCLQPPRRQYRHKLVTLGPVGFSGIMHVNHSTPPSQWVPQVVELARAHANGGFTKEVSAKRALPDVTTGFGHKFVLSLAGEIVGAIKAGHLKDVFVIGGCDGTESQRSYFTDLAKELPQSSVILTLGCGKFRLNRREYGNVPNTPIPRLLDVGQCNDAASAVIIATKLAEALGCGVHDLPLHFAVSWFEQKAAAVLCTLLHLGFKNIRLGPRLPAFITPNILDALVKNYNLKPTIEGNEKADLAAMLAGK